MENYKRVLVYYKVLVGQLRYKIKYYIHFNVITFIGSIIINSKDVL